MRVFACYWNAPEGFWRIFYFGRLLQKSQSQKAAGRSARPTRAYRAAVFVTDGGGVK
jgi:hypothetical protein